MQLWLHLSLDFDPNSFSLLMHLHHLAHRGQQFPGIILISRPLSHPCAIYISAETRASRATLRANIIAGYVFAAHLRAKKMLW